MDSFRVTRSDLIVANILSMIHQRRLPDDCADDRDGAILWTDFLDTRKILTHYAFRALALKLDITPPLVMTDILLPQIHG